jgi:heat shock protein HtpX
MDLFQQQASNRRRTWLVMAVFVAFLFLLGYGFDRAYLRTWWPITAWAALAAGAIGAYAGFQNGDKAVLASASAVPLGELLNGHPADADRLKYTQFDNVVEEMAIAAGLPMPRLFVIPDPDPNAFATGRDPEHASIAVTKGLLDTLNREELQGVVAHEMSHVRNLDIRLMTIVAALVGAVVLLSDFIRRWMFWGGGKRGGGSRDKEGSGVIGAVLMVVWVIAIILAPVIGQLLSMMVSRRREYLADASGAELTRNPLALASALQRIEFAVEPTKSIRRGTANLCIADPLGREIGTREGGWSDLFASHPPMVKRLAALRDMAYER